MNSNLSKLIEYFRKEDPNWDYSGPSPLNALPKLFPEYFSWNDSWETYAVRLPLPAGVAPVEYVAEFLGISVSDWLSVSASMDLGTTQEEFLKKLEEVAK